MADVKMVVDCSAQERDENGVLISKVEVVPLTEDELAQREKDAVEAVKVTTMMVRAERNARLAACDWTDLPNAPLTDEQRESWLIYRQQLRDMPAEMEDPTRPPWPTPPS